MVAASVSRKQRLIEDLEAEFGADDRDRPQFEPLTLPQFIKAAWHIVEPGRDYQHNWHIDAISDHLSAVTLGDLKNLLINIPPRHAKSLTVCVFWPCWEWAEINPASRWLFSSYAQSLSKRDSLKCRRIIQSRWYQQRYGHCFKLTGDQNEKLRFENDRTGHRIATSVGGAGTGEGGDRIVVDDPHKVNEAESEAVRESTLEWWDEEMSTRGNDPKTAAKVIVMQRVHDKDLSGHVLEQGGYTHLCLPAEFEPNRRSVTPLWSDPRTAPGELLWGDRVGQGELTEFKTRLGSYGYAGQFQQRPSPATGGLFKRDWWKFYKVPPANFDRVIQSWDCTFKDAKTSDFVVGQVWGKAGSEYYLLDQVRDRMDINATLTAIRSLSAKWPQAKAKLVEDKANGSAVIDLLKREISGLIPINPQGGKVVRATAIAPYIEAGNVYLPDPSIAPWAHDLVEEFSAFPNGANDDQVDSASQSIAWLEENKPFAIRSSGIRVY